MSSRQFVMCQHVDECKNEACFIRLVIVHDWSVWLSKEPAIAGVAHNNDAVLKKLGLEYSEIIHPEFDAIEMYGDIVLDCKSYKNYKE